MTDRTFTAFFLLAMFIIMIGVITMKDADSKLRQLQSPINVTDAMTKCEELSHCTDQEGEYYLTLKKDSTLNCEVGEHHYSMGELDVALRFCEERP